MYSDHKGCRFAEVIQSPRIFLANLPTKRLHNCKTNDVLSFFVVVCCCSFFCSFLQSLSVTPGNCEILEPFWDNFKSCSSLLRLSNLRSELSLRRQNFVCFKKGQGLRGQKQSFVQILLQTNFAC